MSEDDMLYATADGVKGEDWGGGGGSVPVTTVPGGTSGTTGTR